MDDKSNEYPKTDLESLYERNPVQKEVQRRIVGEQKVSWGIEEEILPHWDQKQALINPIVFQDSRQGDTFNALPELSKFWEPEKQQEPISILKKQSYRDSATSPVPEF